MRERVRVSWGSTLFSLASASPGREKGKRGGWGLWKDPGFVSYLPPEVEVGGRWGLGWEMCKGGQRTLESEASR